MKKVLFLLISIILFSVSLKAQKEMTEEEWQKQMDSLTLIKIKLLEVKTGLDKMGDSIRIENKKLDSILGDKKTEMYKILGVSFYQVSEYKKKFWDLYDRIENRIGDYESMCDELEAISRSRIRLLYEFRKPFEKMKKNLENFDK
ncbi:MAG: hypothetical protein NTU73_14310 [Ignavibacteriae bacterium]|nr:hypothetical protein [Ignavibacteriota bacterium]